MDEIKSILSNRKNLTNSFNYYNEIINWIESNQVYFQIINNCLFLLFEKR